MGQPSHHLGTLFPPVMNLLLTYGLINSIDTISYTGLEAVILIDLSSIEVASRRCCIHI